MIAYLDWSPNKSKFSENINRFVYTSQLSISGSIRKLKTDNLKTYICVWKKRTEFSVNIIALLSPLVPLSQYWLLLEIFSWQCWDGFFFVRVLTVSQYEKMIVFWATLRTNSAKSITQITNDDLTKKKKNHKLSKFLTSSVAINLHKKYSPVL